MIPRPQMAYKIDRQAWAWHEKLMSCWLTASPAYHDEGDLAALFLHFGMVNGPLPHERLELIRMATDRENPSFEAFVTLALMEMPEDQRSLPVGERSAKLPYQLAWAREGRTLGARTGMPGGIERASWPS